MKLLFLLATALVVFLTGCGQATLTPEATTLPGATAVPPAEIVVTPRQVPTLYPTATSLPTPSATPTRPPQPTAVPNTPIAFDQVVVDIHYRLPALGLDRRLQGDVSGRLTMEDRATGVSVVRDNQSRVLLEMQQGLARLTLAELPDDCQTCVWMTYDLPLSGLAESGWLDDVTMLASLDNFTGVHLGPHVPPDTWLALRRSATSYWVGHTVAVTSDGRLWHWLATEGRIAEPSPLGLEGLRLQTALAALEGTELADTYSDSCTDAARETLFLPGADEAVKIRIICPALSLPAALLPLYLQLEALVDESIVAEGRPPRGLPLTALLSYKTADNERLLIFDDNQVQVESGNDIYTGTLSASQVVSLTAGLEQSGLLTLPASDVLMAEPGANGLIVRGAGGVSGAIWRGAPRREVAPLVMDLDRLVTELGPRESEAPVPPGPMLTGTASAIPAGTPTPTGAGVTVTPTP
jgi:hypothetical protein